MRGHLEIRLSYHLRNTLFYSNDNAKAQKPRGKYCFCGCMVGGDVWRGKKSIANVVFYIGTVVISLKALANQTVIEEN